MDQLSSSAVGSCGTQGIADAFRYLHTFSRGPLGSFGAWSSWILQLQLHLVGCLAAAMSSLSWLQRADIGRPHTTSFLQFLADARRETGFRSASSCQTRPPVQSPCASSTADHALRVTGHGTNWTAARFAFHVLTSSGCESAKFSETISFFSLFFWIVLPFFRISKLQVVGR